MESATKKKTKGKEIMIYTEGLPVQQWDEFTKLNLDLMLDIFSRLPLKSLSSCKFVCKSWFNLIYDPSLAEQHYARSVANNTSPCVLLYDRWKDFFLIDHQVFDEMQTKASLYNVKFRGDFIPKFEIVGSVNGLICFAPDTRTKFELLPYYVCNPITREYLSLPMSPKNDKCPSLSGFGFDSVTNEYKVIRMLQNKETLKAEAEIFTIGSDAWRVKPSVSYITDRRQSNVLVNGALHWISKYGGKTAIVSFVIASEKFHLFQLPACINNVENRGKEKYLAVLGNCLAFIMADSVVHAKKKEIWVMKEYRARKYWVKEYTVKQELLVSARGGGYALTKLRNDKFLVQFKRKALVYYDPQSKTIKLIVIQDKLWEGCHDQALIHVGSLFSPSNIGKLQKSSIK